MKNRSVILVLILSLMFTGCQANKDVNTVMYALTYLIDVDKEGLITIYMELLYPVRQNETNTEKGQRVIIFDSGKTLFEAIRNVNNKANFKVNLTQNCAIIFTKAAAEYGLDHFLDFLVRDQEALLRPYVLIYEGDPLELFTIEFEQRHFIGIYLDELLDNQVANTTSGNKKLYQYMNHREIISTDVLSILNIKKMENNPSLEIKGGAVFKDDKMVGTLNSTDLSTFNLMMGLVKSGIIVLPHPDSKDKYITLEVLRSKVKNKLQYDGKPENLMTWKHTLDLKITFAESQDAINLEKPETIKKIKQSLEEKLDEDFQKLFNEYKLKEVDIFRVQEKFYRKYPQDKVQDVIKITQLENQFHIFIQGSTDILEFE